MDLVDIRNAIDEKIQEIKQLRLGLAYVIAEDEATPTQLRTYRGWVKEAEEELKALQKKESDFRSRPHTVVEVSKVNKIEPYDDEDNYD